MSRPYFRAVQDSASKGSVGDDEGPTSRLDEDFHVLALGVEEWFESGFDDV